MTKSVDAPYVHLEKDGEQYKLTFDRTHAYMTLDGEDFAKLLRRITIFKSTMHFNKFNCQVNRIGEVTIYRFFKRE